MLISQTVSPLVTPSIREAMLFGGARGEWERIFDDAAGVRQDDAVLRVLEAEARREEHRREQERRGVWCAPAPVASRVGRPHIFRALFRKDIGGVAGVSDSWFDTDFCAVDGVSGKAQSWVDYIDNTHLARQTVSGSQAALPSANVNFASSKTAPFSASYYPSNRAASAFTFRHDGTGMEETTVFSPTSLALTYIYSSTRPAGIGASIGWNPPTPSFAVSKASGFAILSLAGSLTANVPTYLDAYYSETASPEFEFRVKGTVVDSGASSQAPDTASPNDTYSIGGNPTGTFTAPMDWSATYLFRRPLNAAQRTVKQNFIRGRTGVVP
jgi:hypothetical protein